MQRQHGDAVGNNLFFNDTYGHVGLDTFKYTISDGRGGIDTATYTVNVVEFIPKDISGTVYIDKDNDGVLDGERLARRDVRLNGTNVLGTPTFAELIAITEESAVIRSTICVPATTR